MFELYTLFVHAQHQSFTTKKNRVQSHVIPTSQWRPNPRTPKCIENGKDKSAQLFEVRAAWANHTLCKSLKADLNEKYCVYIYIYI